MLHVSFDNEYMEYKPHRVVYRIYYFMGENTLCTAQNGVDLSNRKSNKYNRIRKPQGKYAIMLVVIVLVSVNAVFFLSSEINPNVLYKVKSPYCSVCRHEETNTLDKYYAVFYGCRYILQ